MVHHIPVHISIIQQYECLSIYRTRPAIRRPKRPAPETALLMLAPLSLPVEDALAEAPVLLADSPDSEPVADASLPPATS
jgi:hypothetical protein